MSYVFSKRESDGYRFPCQVRCDGCHRTEELRGDIQDLQYTDVLPRGFARAHWVVGKGRVSPRHLCGRCVRDFGHFQIEEPSK